MPGPTICICRGCQRHGDGPCGTPTLNGSRCVQCNRGFRQATRNPVYATREWMNRSRRELAAWRRRYGDWCPGYRMPGHRTADLTLDHVMPLARGGAPDGPTQVLCRSCNTRKRLVETPTRPAGGGGGLNRRHCC